MKLITIHNIKLGKGEPIAYLQTLELLVPTQHRRALLLPSLSRLILPLGSQQVPAKVWTASLRYIAENLRITPRFRYEVWQFWVFFNPTLHFPQHNVNLPPIPPFTAILPQAMLPLDNASFCVHLQKEEICRGIWGLQGDYFKLNLKKRRTHRPGWCEVRKKSSPL